jgi:hypothetical protein
LLARARPIEEVIWGVHHNSHNLLVDGLILGPWTPGSRRRSLPLLAFLFDCPEFLIVEVALLLDLLDLLKEHLVIKEGLGELTLQGVDEIRKLRLALLVDCRVRHKEGGTGRLIEERASWATMT